MSTPSPLTSERREEAKLAEEWRDKLDVSLAAPSDSRGREPSVVADPCEPSEVVERQRDSSGQAPIARVGAISGDGESRRKVGG